MTLSPLQEKKKDTAKLPKKKAFLISINVFFIKYNKKPHTPIILLYILN